MMVSYQLDLEWSSPFTYAGLAVCIIVLGILGDYAYMLKRRSELPPGP